MQHLLLSLLDYLYKNEYASIVVGGSNPTGDLAYIIENTACGIQIEYLPALNVVHLMKQAADFDGYVLVKTWEFYEEAGEWAVVYDSFNFEEEDF